MADDFDVNRWMWRASGRMRRSATGLVTGQLDQAILRRRAVGRSSRHRVSPWLAAVAWLFLPGWPQLTGAALAGGLAAAIWWLLGRGSVPDGWEEIVSKVQAQLNR